MFLVNSGMNTIYIYNPLVLHNLISTSLKVFILCHIAATYLNKLILCLALNSLHCKCTVKLDMHRLKAHMHKLGLIWITNTNDDNLLWCHFASKHQLYTYSLFTWVYSLPNGTKICKDRQKAVILRERKSLLN